MSIEEGIPVFMIGRSAENGQHILPALRPRYDVIQFCTSTDAARREYPLALDGRPINNPQTTIGSNAHRGSAPQRPKAVFVGAGFTTEDFEAFRGDVGALAPEIIWVREEKSDIEGLDDPANWVEVEGLGRIPSPAVLTKSVKKCLARDLGSA